MNEEIRSVSGRTTRLLHAYHDGELSRFARWRFERRLRRSPELQSELAALAVIGAWVRDAQPGAQSPDLWSAIALRLPAIDARRANAAEEERGGLGWLVWPSALASAALAAVFALVSLGPPDATPPRKIGIVRWIDSGPRDVMVLEAAPDTTVVWVIGAPAKAARRT